MRHGEGTIIEWLLARGSRPNRSKTLAPLTSTNLFALTRPGCGFTKLCLGVYVRPSFLPLASLAQAKPTRAAYPHARLQVTLELVHTSHPCLLERYALEIAASEPGIGRRQFKFNDYQIVSRLRLPQKAVAVRRMLVLQSGATTSVFFLDCACIINRLCLTKSGHTCEVCTPQLVNRPLPASLDAFCVLMDMLRSSIYVTNRNLACLPARSVLQDALG